MGRQSGTRQGKEVRADRPDAKPPRLTVGPIAVMRDRQIVLEEIDPDLISSAELDVLERYFGDLVMQVLDRRSHG